MTTLTRFPSKEAIAASYICRNVPLFNYILFQIAIKNVLLAECESKTKFQKAVTFCGHLLTALRAEERRRVYSYMYIIL